MKITVELNTIEEMEQFLGAMKAKKGAKQEGFEMAPMPMMEPAAPTPQQYQKPEVLPQAPASAAALAPEPQPAPAPAAEPEKTYKAVSFDDVTKAAIKLMDAGRQDDLRQLLVKYGVQALPELKTQPDKLAQFYSDLEVM